MRVSAHTKNRKPKSIPINSKATVNNGVNNRSIERKKHWQKRFNERSKHYVVRRPFIHYADRFSRAKE